MRLYQANQLNIIHNFNKLSIFRDENMEMTIEDIKALIAADEWKDFCAI